MKVYSDKLTRADLFSALPQDVGAVVVGMKRTRKRANGWTVSLEGYGARHTRRRNSGIFGATDPNESMAATWDDHGVWMAELFRRDPNAIIAIYNGRDDFERTTRKHREYIRSANKPGSVRWGQHLAPWLDPAPLKALRNAVTGRIERGEAEAITEVT